MEKSQSEENYLETILILSKTKPAVRSVDIANTLGFKKSSVSVAMKNLRSKNHIAVNENGFISLTDTGRLIAEKIYERHEILTEFFTLLGVPSSISEEDACLIEHIISDESFFAIKNHLNNFFKNNSNFK